MKHLSDLIRSGHKVIYLDVTDEKTVQNTCSHVYTICAYHNIKAKTSVIYGVDTELHAYKLLRVELECAIDPRKTKAHPKDEELEKIESELEENPVSESEGSMQDEHEDFA